jgi:hypothetical protein
MTRLEAFKNVVENTMERAKSGPGSELRFAV